MYCNEVWGNTYKTYLDPLIKIQKRAIRVVASANRLSHTDPIFEKLRLLKLNEIHIYTVQLSMFKYQHNKLPHAFNDFFVRNNAFHDYPTSQNFKLRVHLSRTPLTSCIIRRTGVILHNYFYDKIDIWCFYNVYKKNLKSYLLNNDVSKLLPSKQDNA